MGFQGDQQHLHVTPVRARACCVRLGRPCPSTVQCERVLCVLHRLHTVKMLPHSLSNTVKSCPWLRTAVAARHLLSVATPAALRVQPPAMPLQASTPDLQKKLRVVKCDRKHP